jgi:cyclopropane fatty-acyl-phospholipid synthase-like methyltransferase
VNQQERRPDLQPAVSRGASRIAGASEGTPVDATGLKNPVTFQFEYAATSSPASVGENDDTRELALGFRRLKITAFSTGRTLCDIDFAAGGNSGDYVLCGFGETEQWGRWSVARKSAIVLRKDFEPMGPLLIELDARPYAGAFASMPFTLTSSAGHRHACVIANQNLIVRVDSETARTCGGSTDMVKAGVEPGAFPREKLRELAGRGYTIEPFLDASDLEALAALYGETTHFVPSEFHVSAYLGDPEIRRKIHKGIAAIVGNKLGALAPGYRLVMALFATKKANSTRGRLALHQDYSLVDHGEHLGLNVWIPLCDVDTRNACLRVVEGSQILGHISANPPNPEPYRNVRQTLDSGTYLRDVPMAGGEAFLFDTRVLHVTEENHTDSDRIAVLLSLVPGNVPARLYQWNERDPDRLEVWEVDTELYLRMAAPNAYIENPELMGAKFAGRIDHKFEMLTLSDLQRILPVPVAAPITIEAIRDARRPVQAHDTADVKNYYDEKTAAYIEGFGEVFQGSRPESTEDLLHYIVEAAKITDGMKILDAGCGVCGPAAWFAEHLDVTIEALTISPVQVREAQTRVNARGVAGRIIVREGDFHKLEELYPPETFDRVLFLETICHSRDYRLVIEQAKRVLKPGGYLYIKDFYCQDFRSRPELREAQLQDLKKLNSVYRLVIPDLASTVDLILELGFRLDYVREPRYTAIFGPWLKLEKIAGMGWNPKLSYLDLISGLEILCRKAAAA